MVWIMCAVTTKSMINAIPPATAAAIFVELGQSEADPDSSSRESSSYATAPRSSAPYVVVLVKGAPLDDGTSDCPSSLSACACGEYC